MRFDILCNSRTTVAEQSKWNPPRFRQSQPNPDPLPSESTNTGPAGRELIVDVFRICAWANWKVTDERLVRYYSFIHVNINQLGNIIGAWKKTLRDASAPPWYGFSQTWAIHDTRTAWRCELSPAGCRKLMRGFFFSVHVLAVVPTIRTGLTLSNVRRFGTL